MALRFDTTRYGPRAPPSAPGRRPAPSPRQSRGAAKRWSSPDDDEESRSAERMQSHDSCAGRIQLPRPDSSPEAPIPLPTAMRGAKRSSPRRMRRRRGDGNFPGCKALKNHKMGKESHPSQIMEHRFEKPAIKTALQVRAPPKSTAPRGRLPGPTGARGRAPRGPRSGPGECGRRGRVGKLSWLQSLEKPQNGKIPAPESAIKTADGDDDGSASPRLHRKSFSSAVACRRPPLLTRARSLVQKPACFASRTRDERGRTAGATG